MAFSQLTVFFEDPFWVGVFEREEDGQYTACKVTFGAEPRDFAVYALVLAHYSSLRFSPALAAEPQEPERRLSPKRRQREAARQVQGGGAGTKAQQALQAQREQGKQAHRARSRAEREAEAALRFAQRQEKRKKKHRGLNAPCAFSCALNGRRSGRASAPPGRS